MLFLTNDLIPQKDLLLSEDLFDLFRLNGLYKPQKRVRFPSDEELVVSLPKVRKTVKSDSDKFEVKLDVKNFGPEDIKVKVIKNNLIVEGKHDERREQNGFVSRQFTRRYELPKDINLDGMTSSLSSDGKLMIEAPLKQLVQNEEIIIPVNVSKPKPTTQITLAEDNKQESDNHQNTTDGTKT